MSEDIPNRDISEPAADWFELALRALAVLGAVAVIALAITVAWVGVPAEVTP